MITASEKKLIGLEESDLLPLGGINYQLYSFSGFNTDSTKSWNALKNSLRRVFDMEFYPGSLNVHTVQGFSWIFPKNLNPQRIQLGIFEIAYVLPVILDEKCIGIAVAINIRGFCPVTTKKLLPPLLLDEPEASAIFSPVNIRERLKLENKEKSDKVPINVRLLSGDLLTILEGL